MFFGSIFENFGGPGPPFRDPLASFFDKKKFWGARGPKTTQGRKMSDFRGADPGEQLVPEITFFGLE